jgi:hypothetical protein
VSLRATGLAVIASLGGHIIRTTHSRPAHSLGGGGGTVILGCGPSVIVVELRHRRWGRSAHSGWQRRLGPLLGGDRDEGVHPFRVLAAVRLLRSEWWPWGRVRPFRLLRTAAVVEVDQCYPLPSPVEKNKATVSQYADFYPTLTPSPNLFF